MSEIEESIRGAIRDAIRSDTHGSNRSRQSQRYQVGISEIGACRNYLRHMLAQTPRDKEDSLKWSAFVGTAIGDRLEMILADLQAHRVQKPVKLALGDDEEDIIPGTCDVFTGDAAIDIKTRDGLALVRNTGPTFREKAQVCGYRQALIDSMEMDPSAPAVLVYLDRSGRDEDFHVVVLTPFECDVIIDQVYERWEDVKIAHAAGIDAPRDEVPQICEQICPFFSTCRPVAVGTDLLDDGTAVFVHEYVKAREERNKAQDLMDEIKVALKGVNGKTDEYSLSWSETKGGWVEGFERKPTTRMSIRKARS